MKRSAVLILFATALVSGGARAVEPAVPAEEISEATGVTKGICSLLSVGDGALAVELGRAGDLLVHGWDPRPADVEAARARADAAGLHGRSVIIEPAAGARLPYADDIVDLVIHLDLTRDSLGGLRPAEILRALCPGGKALLGRLKTNAGDSALAAADLARWLEGAGSATGSTRDDDRAVWAVVTKPRRPGEADWSHWEHGPDNNPVSDDALIKAPYRTQWLGRPYTIAMPAITTPISAAVRPLSSRNNERNGKNAAMTIPNRMNRTCTATAGRIFERSGVRIGIGTVAASGQSPRRKTLVRSWCSSRRV